MTRRRERIQKSRRGESGSGPTLREVKVKIPGSDYRNVEAITFRVLQKFV